MLFYFEFDNNSRLLELVYHLTNFMNGQDIRRLDRDVDRYSK